MLTEFESMLERHSGTITTAKHCIKLVDLTRTPAQLAPYRAEPKSCEFGKTQIIEMLEDDIIELAQIEWASPTVFKAKKHGTLRLCADYRKVNDLIKLDSYPVPQMDE